MIPMFKQKVGMTKIYAKGIAELFLIRCNPYHWDGSGEVPDNISFDVYKRKIDETYDGCTLEIQLCKPDGCLCYAASVHLYTECLNLAKSIDAIMLCYNPDIDALKAENLSDMAVRLLDGVSRRDVVKDLEDFRDKWRHYNEQAAAESQVILDKISELFEKDGDSK
jgi:hypothetical protein